MNEFKLNFGGKELIIQANNLAEKANGSCFVRYGDTLLLVTAVMSKEEKNLGFFPLTVDYEERFYAAGKIMGSRYIRRESRPTDEAILTARLIDRAVRPLFPKKFFKEVQIIVTCLSWDRENDPDIIGLIGTSVALSISEIPWLGPVGCVRISRKNGEFILNPTYEQREKSDLDLVLAGIEKNEEILLNMIESESQEVPEDVILQAYKFASSELKKVIEFQNQIVKKIGVPKITYQTERLDLELEKEVKNFIGNKLEEILFSKEKKEKTQEINQLKEELNSFIESKYPSTGKNNLALEYFDEEINKLVHQRAIQKGERVDSRKPDEIREISCQVGLLPRTHGSGLFCRGQTKTLSILTLGAPGDSKLLEGMEIVGKKRFMHHYNFPPYSVGEVKPLRGPARRDIGHGMLVEKALLPVVPSFEQFPYTIRIVSEILSSNGSTSMASCSSASLALMDAGVPIKAPVAGISIGLMSDNDRNYKLLADIQGPEDHHGDMDFKIAGTKKGITAIQMDVKINGITEEIFKNSLFLARKIREKILDKMAQVLPEPRKELSPFAPRIFTLQINPEKIREVIGPGGKVINKIIQDCGVLIDIEDSGAIFITAEKEAAAQQALEWIKSIVKEVQTGEIFRGKVKRILDFGAFVEILPNQEGMIHISQLAPRRVRKVEDIVKIGDEVEVKVKNIDEQGRINLTLLKNYSR
jgi:polyribonucleotide nucleotidyltransferase